MTVLSSQVSERFAEGSFNRLIWSQQVNNVQKYPKQRHWHPMIIRWCLHLKMLSNSAYEALRDVLTLPCGRTLRDYTHYIKSEVGIQVELVHQLMTERTMELLADWQKYVAVVYDEIKIKEGLVYDKHEHKVTGFSDLGTINNTLKEFEQSLECDLNE
jgi:hypothetical protein